MKNVLSSAGALPAVRPLEALRTVGAALHEAITQPAYRLLHKLILKRLLRYAARMHHA